MVVVGIILLASILFVGNIYLQIHSLPERMAHKSQKLQFEIVAVLCLLALFTHNHLFWVIALLLALVDLPDFSTPLRSIAGSVQKMAGIPPDPDPSEPTIENTHTPPADASGKSEEPRHA
jgi:multisubunit Na+/H+ antiporter MnhF subunit